jgi:hypothetical protein
VVGVVGCPAAFAVAPTAPTAPTAAGALDDADGAGGEGTPWFGSADAALELVVSGARAWGWWAAALPQPASPSAANARPSASCEDRLPVPRPVRFAPAGPMAPLCRDLNSIPSFISVQFIAIGRPGVNQQGRSLLGGSTTAKEEFSDALVPTEYGGAGFTDVMSCAGPAAGPTLVFWKVGAPRQGSATYGGRLETASITVIIRRIRRICGGRAWGTVSNQLGPLPRVRRLQVELTQEQVADQAELGCGRFNGWRPARPLTRGWERCRGCHHREPVRERLGGQLLSQAKNTYPSISKSWVDTGFKNAVIEHGAGLGTDNEVVSRNRLRSPGHEE